MIAALLRRGLASAALAATFSYLVPSWLATEGVPIGVRLLWPVAALGAAVAPGASLLAFVAGAPLLPILPELQGWPRVSLVQMWVFALLVPAWLRVAFGHAPPVLPRTAALVLALVSASLVATLAGFAVPLGGGSGLASALHGFLRDDFATLAGQRHVYASVLAWAIVAEGIGLGWLFWRWLDARGRGAGHALAVATLTGALLVAGWGVRQWWTGEHLLPFWREVDPFITRINATFTDVNTLGSYLAGALVLAVAVAMAPGSRRARQLALAAGLVIAPALVFTASRVAWVAALAGIGAYVVSVARSGAWQAVPGEQWRRARRRGLAGVAVGVLALVALTAYATVINATHATQRSYVDTVLYTLNLRVPLEDKFKGRLALWEAGARMVQARPVSGIGIGRFYKDVSRYARDPDDLIRPQENAHNYFLQFAAETGLPTLVAWLGMIVALAFGPRQPARTTKDAVALHVSAGGRGALVAFLITCTTGHPLLLREGQVAFWTWMALAASAASVAGPGDAATPRRWFTVALLFIVAWAPWRAAAELRGVDRARFPQGLHEVEIGADAAPFQWSRAEATFFVPATARAVTLTMRSVAPVAQSVQITVEGEVVDTLRLDDHAWRPLRYALPRQPRTGDYFELRLRVTPTWRPPGDGRDLGVMVRGFAWTP